VASSSLAVKRQLVHLKQEDPNEKAGALVAIDKKDGATERADG
jgi:hypothetical protein